MEASGLNNGIPRTITSAVETGNQLSSSSLSPPKAYWTLMEIKMRMCLDRSLFTVVLRCFRQAEEYCIRNGSVIESEIQPIYIGLGPASSCCSI
jgi:hypothetical protein